MHLFTNTLEDILSLQNGASDHNGTGFTARGIELAHDFLTEKIHFATMGIAAVDQVAELVKVCFETGAFLADVGTIGKEGEFFEEAFVVEVDFEAEFLKALMEGIALLSGGLLCFLSNHLTLLLKVFELFE